MQLPDKDYSEMLLTIEKIIAVYELLHAHARGQTDLTDDQLANVVTGVTSSARDVLGRCPGYVDPRAASSHGRPLAGATLA